MSEVPPRATVLSDLLPTAEVHVRVGDVELRGITDDVLCGLVDLACDGIHPSTVMPFRTPWSQQSGEDLARSMAAYHWGVRAEFAPAAWCLELAVFHRGALVGAQGVRTTDFLLTRTGETGSWLGSAHQGRGIGTAMRRGICALLFDHLGAREVTSAAYVDNPASLAVSRAVGYVDNGTARISRTRAGVPEAVLEQRLLLRPEAFERGPEPIDVSGVASLRRAIGLGLVSSSG